MFCGTLAVKLFFPFPFFLRYRLLLFFLHLFSLIILPVLLTPFSSFFRFRCFFFFSSFYYNNLFFSATLQVISLFHTSTSMFSFTSFISGALKILFCLSFFPFFNIIIVLLVSIFIFLHLLLLFLLPLFPIHLLCG